MIVKNSNELALIIYSSMLPGDTTEEKIANVIVGDMEKQASGASSFVSRLTGSESKVLKREIKDLEKKLGDEMQGNDKIKRALDSLKEKKRIIGTPDEDPVLKPYRENYEKASNKYQQRLYEDLPYTAKHTGIMKPLGVINPGNIVSKIKRTSAEFAKTRSKQKLDAAKGMADKINLEAISNAERGYENVLKEEGVHDLTKNLSQKKKALSEAQTKTEKARRTATGIAAAGGIGALAVDHMNKKKNEVGPYYSQGFQAQASENISEVEKLAYEILGIELE